MQTLLNAACRKEVFNRLAELSPDDKPKWGMMSAPQMIAHVSRQLKCAFGFVNDKTLSTIWRFWPINKLVIYVIPWPRGLPTAEAWKDPERRDWKSEAEQLQKLIEKFSGENESVNWGLHPILGSLTEKDWATLSYRHIDHHFRQFGV